MIPSAIVRQRMKLWALPTASKITENSVVCQLRHPGFFCNLPKPTPEKLEKIKYASAYLPCAVLFAEGQTPRGVYIGCDGRANLSTTARAGKTLILRIAQAGEILGLHATEWTAAALQACSWTLCAAMISSGFCRNTATRAFRPHSISAGIARRRRR